MTYHKFIQRYSQMMLLQRRDIPAECRRRTRLRLMKVLSLLYAYALSNPQLDHYAEKIQDMLEWVRGWPYIPGPRLPTIANVKKIKKMSRSLF